MINKDLIELQKGCPATCTVILNEDLGELENSFVMNADKKDTELFSCRLGNPFFKEDIDKISRNDELAYFIIKGLDTLSIDLQNRYVGLVKDREFMGYNLPENVIITFSVDNKEGLKKISSELYHFCVVAF